MYMYRIFFISEGKYLNRKYKHREVAEDAIVEWVASKFTTALNRPVYAYEFEVVKDTIDYLYGDADVIVYGSDEFSEGNL